MTPRWMQANPGHGSFHAVVHDEAQPHCGRHGCVPVEVPAEPTPCSPACEVHDAFRLMNPRHVPGCPNTGGPIVRPNDAGWAVASELDAATEPTTDRPRYNGKGRPGLSVWDTEHARPQLVHAEHVAALLNAEAEGRVLPAGAPAEPTTDRRWDYPAHIDGRLAFYAATADDRTAICAKLERLDKAEAEGRVLPEGQTVERVEAWKAEAMTVMAEWDKVYEALGKPGQLGQSMAAAALTEVERMKGRVLPEDMTLYDRLEAHERALRLQGRLLDPNDPRLAIEVQDDGTLRLPEGERKMVGLVTGAVTWDRVGPMTWRPKHPEPKVPVEVGQCPFCAIVNDGAKAEVVREWDDAICIKPLNPVVEGHLLVLPKQHVASVFSSPDVSAVTMRRVAELLRERLQRRHEPHDHNVITSAGPAATQTVKHLHFHVVPRTAGDGLALPWTGQAAAIGQCSDCGDAFGGAEHFHACEPYDGCDEPLGWHVRGSVSDFVCEARDEATARTIAALLNAEAEGRVLPAGSPSADMLLAVHAASDDDRVLDPDDPRLAIEVTDDGTLWFPAGEWEHEYVQHDGTAPWLVTTSDFRMRPKRPDPPTTEMPAHAIRPGMVVLHPDTGERFTVDDREDAITLYSRSEGWYWEGAPDTPLRVVTEGNEA